MLLCYVMANLILFAVVNSSPVKLTGILKTPSHLPGVAVPW